jgi:hypothetical protein
MMKKHPFFFFFRMLLIILFLSLTTACASLSWNRPLLKRVPFEEPIPSGVPEVDQFTNEAFQLYASMAHMIADFENFKAYLTGVANEPISFLTQTLTMDIEQSAHLASLRYHKPIALESDILRQTIIDIQTFLESEPTLKRHFLVNFRDLQTQLLTQEYMTLLRRVLTKILFLIRFSKALKSTLSSPVLSLTERLHALHNLKKSVSVLGYLLITSKKMKSVRRALVKLPVTHPGLLEPSEEEAPEKINRLPQQAQRQEALPSVEKQWEVQVACFKAYERAEQLRQRLENHDFGARISVKNNAQCPYRVLLVQLKFTPDEAEQHLQFLYHKLNIKGFRRKVD